MIGRKVREGRTEEGHEQKREKEEEEMGRGRERSI